MEMIATLAALAVCLAVAGGCGWMGARAPDPSRGPRMVPWRFLMILAACAGFLCVVHLVNLLGITTGRQS